MFFTKIKNNIKYSDLSSGEQKRIILKSIRGANKDQLELVKRFDREFNKLEPVK